jgi:probable F420-dependent oxidoreductase
MNAPLALDGVLDAALHDVGEQAASREADGWDGLFTYEGRSDAFFPLVAAATATHRSLLYTNIAVALPRSPMHLATAAFDLQRLSGGRFVLGVGSQVRAHIERRYSATWDRPAARLRDLVTATRHIMASWQQRQPINHQGEFYTHTLHAPLLCPEPLEGFGPPPVWMAAVGPVMTRMAGEVADGLLVHPFTTADFVRQHTLPLLGEGLERSGRVRHDVCVNVGAMVGLADTAEEHERALAALRLQLGFYGSTPAYRVVLDQHGWGDLQPMLRTMTREGQWDRLGSVWTDEQVETLAVVGTPAEVAARLRARFSGLADRVSVQVAGSGPGSGSGHDPRAEELRRALVTAWRQDA